MNSHNPKPDAAAKPAAVAIASDHSEARVMRADRQEAADLEISDEQDFGGDPYNSTGQHVIVKIKQDFSE